MAGIIGGKKLVLLIFVRRFDDFDRLSISNITTRYFTQFTRAIAIKRRLIYIPDSGPIGRVGFQCQLDPTPSAQSSR